MCDFITLPWQNGIATDIVTSQPSITHFGVTAVYNMVEDSMITKVDTAVRVRITPTICIICLKDCRNSYNCACHCKGKPHLKKTVLLSKAMLNAAADENNQLQWNGINFQSVELNKLMYRDIILLEFEGTLLQGHVTGVDDGRRTESRAMRRTVYVSLLDEQELILRGTMTVWQAIGIDVKEGDGAKSKADSKKKAKTTKRKHKKSQRSPKKKQSKMPKEDSLEDHYDAFDTAHETEDMNIESPDDSNDGSGDGNLDDMDTAGCILEPGTLLQQKVITSVEEYVILALKRFNDAGTFDEACIPITDIKIDVNGQSSTATPVGCIVWDPLDRTMSIKNGHFLCTSLRTSSGPVTTTAINPSQLVNPTS